MHEVAAALLEHFGWRCHSLSPLTGGFIHQVWRAETNDGARVVKLYTGPGWSPQAIASTLDMQMVARSAGAPTPRVHRTVSGGWLAPAGAGWIAVWDLAAGETLPAARLDAQAAGRLGAELARLHKILTGAGTQATAFVPSAAAVRERCESLLTAARMAQPSDDMDLHAVEAAEFRLQELHRRPPHPGDYAGQVAQVVHGDFHPANLLFDACGRVAAVIDWDFCGVNWRGQEIARAAVETAMCSDDSLDMARVEAFLRGYQAEHPLELAERRGMFRCWFNYLLFSLYPLPIRYKQGAVMPQGWRALAHKRHRILTTLAQHLETLERI